MMINPWLSFRAINAIGHRYALNCLLEHSPGHRYVIKAIVYEVKENLKIIQLQYTLFNIEGGVLTSIYLER